MFLRTSFTQKQFARVVVGVVSGLLAAFTSPASAQTLVCGPILANTTWDLSGSPWELTCDVSVLGGATLTIDPGVAVIFHPGTQLVVQAGNVVANGTPFSPISFSSLVVSNPGNGVPASLSREDIKSLLLMLVDIVVQFGMKNHRRFVKEIWYDPAAKRQQRH